MILAFSLPGTGSAERLAWESSANNINAFKFPSIKLPDVAENWDIGPMLAQPVSAGGFNLAEPNGSHSGSFKSKAKPSYSAE